MPSESLPAGWSLEHSRTHGRAYYYHAATGKVTWECPWVLPSLHEDVVADATVDACQPLLTRSLLPRTQPSTPKDPATHDRGQNLVGFSQESPRQHLVQHASAIREHIHLPSGSPRSVDLQVTDFNRKEQDGDQDSNTIGELTTNSDGGLSSPNSSDSVGESMVAERVDAEDMGLVIPRLEALTRRMSQKSLRPTVPLCSGNATHHGAEALIACTSVEAQIDAPEPVLQLSQEIDRYESAGCRVDDLTLLISNVELEQWAVEVAPAREHNNRFSLEEQLRCLEIDLRSKTVALEEAQRELAQSELKLYSLLVGAGEANQQASSGLDSQPRAKQWFSLQAQLLSLEGRLRKRSTRQSALLAEIVKCTTSSIACSNAIALSTTASGRKNIDRPSERSPIEEIARCTASAVAYTNAVGLSALVRATKNLDQ